MSASASCWSLSRWWFDDYLAGDGKRGKLKLTLQIKRSSLNLQRMHWRTRTACGAEVDLVLYNCRVRVAIECKFSSTPKPARGFHKAMIDLEADKDFVIAPMREAFDSSARVRLLPINDLSAVWGALG